MDQATPDRKRACTGSEDDPSNGPEASRATATHILELIGLPALDRVKVSPSEDKLLARVLDLYNEHARQDLEPLDRAGPKNPHTSVEVERAPKSRPRHLDRARNSHFAERSEREDPPTLDISAVLVSEEVRPHRSSEPVKPSSGATEA